MTNQHEFRDHQRAALMRTADDVFEIHFWPNYPRRVGKKIARKAFHKACSEDAAENNITPLTAAQKITKAMLAQKSWPEGQGLNKNHGEHDNPHPTTWLNQGRWDDEPSAKSQWRPKEP